MTPAVPQEEERLRARLAVEGLVGSVWSNGPGDTYPEHRHEYDKVLVVASGSIRFHLPQQAREMELHESDRADLPAGTVHGALVGPRGVVCIEAHLAPGALGTDPRARPGWGAEAAGGTAETAPVAGS